MNLKFLKCLAAGAILGSLALASCGEPNTLTTPVESTEEVKGVDITLRDGLTKESPLCISKAIEKCAANDADTRYYVKGKITAISDESFGSMTIEDITGSLFVYGTYGEDGVDRYNALANKPVVGDTVLLYATLVTYNGTPEVKSGWIIDFGSHLVDENPIAGGQQGSEGNNGGNNNGGTTTEGDGLSEKTAFSIKDAITQCSKDDGKEYYIKGTVKAISSYQYGAMTLVGEDGSELYIYGVHGANDEFFDALDSSQRPSVGDVLILRGILTSYNGTLQGGANQKQMKIVSFSAGEKTFDEKNYTQMSIKEAREAKDGKLIKVTGVVAKITVDSGSSNSGLIITDGESSIYLYGANIAVDAKVGNEITVYGEKDYWINESEQSYASKFGYEGCCQLSNCYLGNLDKTVKEVDLSWCEEKTIKELMNIDCSENITTTIYKVTALVDYRKETGFNNAYIYDLNATYESASGNFVGIGSYIYSQNNGKSIDWLAPYDGQICTMYISVMNAKSSAAGCGWRFMDISVEKADVTFDLNDTAKHVMEYYAKDQFESVYYGDPEKELVTSVSSDLLKFEGATVSYESSNTDAFYIENGKLHTKNAGKANITITVKYGTQTETKTIEVEYVSLGDINAISVGQLFEKEVGSEQTIRGIVSGGLVNKVGFYLISDDGVIAVLCENSIMNQISIGNEIIIKGILKTANHGSEEFHKDDAVYSFDASELVVNLGGQKTPSTKSYVECTLAEALAQAKDKNCTNKIYQVKATSKKEGNAYYTNLIIEKDGSSLLIYAGNGQSQHAWLFDYVGQEITYEISFVDWNGKGFKGAVVSIVLADGTRIYNPNSF